MQDRVSVNPGRVLITPEDGSSAFYATMTRADNPTQEGTKLNKASLLKDATAALYGLDSDAVPDDVLALLSRFHAGLGNEYLWEKYGTVHHNAGYTLGESESLWVTTGGGASTGQEQYNYSDSVSVADDGTVSLVNPSSIYLPMNAIDDKQAQMFGKYVERVRLAGTIYYIPPDCTMSLTTSTTYNQAVFDKANKLTGYAAYDANELIEYVNSPDPSAYPPAVSDGYTYTALGQIGNKVQIETGSYTGTGTYGSSNLCSLMFDFTPKMIMIFGKLNNASNAYFGFWVQGSYGMPTFVSRAGGSSNGSVSYGQNASLSENTFSWYSNYGNEKTSLNAKSELYSYVAIG